MMTTAKEEQQKITLEALRLRRKLLQEHYKNALVTPAMSTSSYQESSGDSSDEYDSENEQQQQQPYMEYQSQQEYQHDENKKKRDLEFPHPKQHQDRTKKKGLVEKDELTSTATMIADETSTIEVVENNSDSMKESRSTQKIEKAIETKSNDTKDKKGHHNQKIEDVQYFKKTRILKNGVEEEILTPIKFKKMSFEEKLEVLAKYKEVHGHCNVSRHTSKHTSLAYWVKRLRQTRQGKKIGYKDFKLTPANIAKLDELGFQWKFSKTFEEHLHDLKEYKAKHGNCKVPYNYKDNKQLGSWVRNTRAAYKTIQAGKKPRQHLTQSMINQLNDMEFSWSLNLQSNFQIPK